jgi:hypothetical protein
MEKYCIDVGLMMAEWWMNGGRMLNQWSMVRFESD